MSRLNQNVTVTYGIGGRILTQEEFMAKPIVIDIANNMEIEQEARRLYDPYYSVKEKAKIRRELTAIRKKELIQQMAEIEKEYAKLDV